MKRLLLQFSLVLALPLIFAGVVSATNHFWKIEISDPTTTDQLRSFNVEFTALSVEDDEITVVLFQDGTVIDSRVTEQGGGSGAFLVEVPEDGTYVYQLSATSSLGGASKASQARAVTVSTPEDAEESIIVVEPELTPEQEAGLIAAGEDGDVAGVVDPETGEITDEAAVTDEQEDENGDVLGVEDTADDEGAVANNTVRIALAVLLALAVAYYWFFYRNGRVNPFSRGED